MASGTRRRRLIETARDANLSTPFGTVPSDVVASQVTSSLKCADVARLARIDKRTAAAFGAERDLCDPENVVNLQHSIAARYLAGAFINAMRRSLTYPVQEIEATSGAGVSFDQRERLLRASPLALHLETSTQQGRQGEWVPQTFLRVVPGRYVAAGRDKIERDGDDVEIVGVDPLLRVNINFDTGAQATRLRDWLFGFVLARNVGKPVHVREERGFYEDHASWIDVPLQDWLTLLDGGATVDGRNFLRVLHSVIFAFDIRDFYVQEPAPRVAEGADQFDAPVPPHVGAFLGTPLVLVRGSFQILSDYNLGWFTNPRIDGLLSSIGRLVLTNESGGYDGVRQRVRQQLLGGNVVRQGDAANRLTQAARLWFDDVDDAIVRESVESDDDRLTLLLRAIYLHVDPRRYQRWLAQNDDRAMTARAERTPFADYLDQVDATFGNGVSTRWIALLPKTPFYDPDQMTIEQLRRLAQIERDVNTFGEVDTVAANAPPALYAGRTASDV